MKKKFCSQKKAKQSKAIRELTKAGGRVGVQGGAAEEGRTRQVGIFQSTPSTQQEAGEEELEREDVREESGQLIGGNNS